MSNIKEILERYYLGQSSQEEEDKLKEFMKSYGKQSKDIMNGNNDLVFEKALFDFFESEKKNELGDDFDEKVLNRISKLKDKKVNYLQKTTIYRITGIAAIFLMAFGLYYIIFQSTIFEEKQTKVILTADEKFAIEQTIDALTLVSDYLNIANEEIGELSIINNSLESIEKVSYYEEYNQYILNILGEES